MKKTKLLLIILIFTLLLAGCSAANAGTEAESETETATEEADIVAPVIQGVTPISVTLGDTISYKTGVVVTDNTDDAPVLNIDASNVDLGREGVYKVVYEAKDSSGNSTSVETTVTIKPRSLIGLDQAYEMADKVLAEILTDEMTEEEQLYAVWIYLHRIPYTDISYSDNYVDNAYYFLEKRAGNCHCYYAASRLMLERMGYLTIDVKNRDHSKLRHFWNLVSVDGGETWYHFDPCGWNWNDKDGLLFMVTDDFLVAFSYSHDFYSHDWEEDLYPATPKEHYGSYDINNDFVRFSDAFIEEAWAAKARNDEIDYNTEVSEDADN